MNINSLLSDIISDLSTLRLCTPVKKTTKKYIPTFKTLEIQNICKQKIHGYCQDFIINVSSKQTKYDKSYQEKLHKRKEYVTQTISYMQNVLDSEETKHVKDLQSKIDFLKLLQGATRLEKIKINKTNSVQIFNFLHKMQLEYEFAWMDDFLKRKIIFDVDVPTETELVVLNKIVDFLSIED